MLVVVGTRGAPAPFTPVASMDPSTEVSIWSRRARSLCISPPALVAAAVEQGVQQRPLANKQRARALRGVHLVAGDGEQVAPDALHVNGNLARGLHGVGVEENVGLGGDLADLLH